MPESWFALGRDDQAEALEVASGRGGRPAHLLEKDLWVVWILSVPPVDQPQFTELLDQCRSIEEMVNRGADYPTN